MKMNFTSLLLFFVFIQVQGQSLVPSFGNQGTIMFNVSQVGKDAARAIAFDTAGNAIVTGVSLVNSNLDYSATRISPGGFIDPSFGSFGYTTIGIGTYDDEADAIVLDKKGRIVMAGNSNSGTRNISVARLNANGLIDNTFAGGKRSIALGTVEEKANAITIDKDGKIILAGATITNNTNYAQSLTVVRLNEDGSNDITFGKNGVTQINAGIYEQFYSVDTDPITNAVFAAGSVSNYTSYANMIIVKYRPNGTPDSSFNLTGIKTFSLDASADREPIFFIKVMEDGKLLIAGDTKINGAEKGLFVMRLNSDGNPDGTFGKNGLILWDNVPGVSEDFNGAAVDKDGRIILNTHLLQGGIYKSFTSCLLPNGSPDLSFNETGIRPILYSSRYSITSKIAVDKHGNIMLVGHAASPSNPQASSYLVSRIKADGSIDDLFSHSGYKLYDLEKGNDNAGPMTAGPAGTFFTIGNTAVSGGSTNLFISKHHSNGELDYSFGLNGTTTTSVFPYSRHITYDAINKLIVSADYKSGYDVYLMKFKENGKVDSTFGKDGLAINNLSGSNDRIAKHIIDSEGNIIVGGYSFSVNNWKFTISRYLANGNLDNTFNTTGNFILKATDVSETATDIKQDKTGKYIIGGYSTNGTGGDANLIFARVNKSGELDNTFGKGGVVIVTDAEKLSQFGYSFELDYENRIVSAGYELGRTNSLLVVRLKTNGELDSTFNGTGKLYYPSTSGNNIKTIIQNDGKIVVAFDHFLNGLGSFKAIRVNANGTIDSTFGDKGLFNISSGYMYGHLPTSSNELIFAASERKDIKLVKVNLPTAPITSIETNDIKGTSETLTAFPNPTDGNFSLDGTDLKVTISTAEGQQVYNNSFYHKETIFLPKKGLYLIRTTTSAGKVSIQKLIVQ